MTDGRSLTAKLDDLATKIDGVLDSVQGLLNQPGSKGMFNDVAAAAQSIRKLADNLDRFTGPGLQKYETLATDGQKTLNEINNAVRSLAEKSAAGHFRRKTERFPNIVAGGKRYRSGVQISTPAGAFRHHGACVESGAVVFLAWKTRPGREGADAAQMPHAFGVKGEPNRSHNGRSARNATAASGRPCRLDRLSSCNCCRPAPVGRRRRSISPRRATACRDARCTASSSSPNPPPPRRSTATGSSSAPDPNRLRC